MADQEYQVVFRGQLLPDWPIEAVKGNLAKLFKADETRIEVLFSGRPVVIKSGLSRGEGERYRLLFEKAGAICDVVPTGGAPAPSSPPHKGVPQASGEPQGSGQQPPDTPDSPGAPSPAPAPPGRKPPMGPAVPPPAGTGDHHHSTGSFRDRLRAIDAEDLREKSSAFFTKTAAAARSGMARGGAGSLVRNKWVWAAGAAVCIAMAVVLLLGGGSKPMPIREKVFDRFAKQYYRELHKTDLASAGTSVLVEQAREVVEDMGFDFDRTLLLWLTHKDRVERQGGLDVYRAILVEPVAVAVAAGLSDIDRQIAPQTRRVFETAASIPPGVALLPIRMIRECPTEGDRLRHDDLLQVLKDHAVPIDEGQPDLSIADAFFGLERAGFVKIHRRWENDVQFADIEVVAPEAMRHVEQQLAYMAEVRTQMAPP